MAISNEETIQLCQFFELEYRLNPPDPASAVAELESLIKRLSLWDVSCEIALSMIHKHPTPDENHRSPWVFASDDATSNLEPAYPLKGLPKGGFEETDSSLITSDFNSCAVDCVATVGKLLQIGFDALDRDGKAVDAWKDTLPRMARVLQELVEQDWEERENVLNRLKMPFYKKCLEGQRQSRTSAEMPKASQQQYLRLLAVSEIWLQLWPQTERSCLSISTISEWDCHVCKSGAVKESPQQEEMHSQISPFDSTITSIERVVNRWFLPEENFSPAYKCRNNHICETRIYTVKGILPDVLVLNLADIAVEGNSTPSKVTFKYDTKRRIELVSYRWLGGIYIKDAHYKVYWRHDNPHQMLSYDHLEGSSIHTIDVTAPVEDKIPRGWWTTGQLVFLEKIYLEGMPRSEKVAKVRRARELDAVRSQPAPREEGIQAPAVGFEDTTISDLGNLLDDESTGFDGIGAKDQQSAGMQMYAQHFKELREAHGEVIKALMNKHNEAMNGLKNSQARAIQALEVQQAKTVSNLEASHSQMIQELRENHLSELSKISADNSARKH